MAPSARERRWVPVLFVAVLLAAPLQWYAKRRTGDEPYPGFFMPGFGNPGGTVESVAVVRDRFVGYYTGGESLALNLTQFLDPLPASHRASFTATYLRSPVRLPASAIEGRRSWARARLAEIRPGPSPDSLAIITERVVFAPWPDSALLPVSRHVLRFGEPRR